MSQPGLMADFVDARGAQAARLRAGRGHRELRRVDRRRRAASTARSTACSSRRPTSRPSGTTSRRSRTPASRLRRPRTTCWPTRRRSSASGVPAYSIGGADGWTLTDLFENIYIRTAGAEKYDQLAEARDPVDRPVGQGRAGGDGEDRRRRRTTSPAARREPCRPTSRPRSSNVFSATPKAAMVLEGDFVPGRRRRRPTRSSPRPGSTCSRSRRSATRGTAVVGGGDLVVMFKDNPAAQAFIEYLTTPEASEIWAKRGGFSSAEQERRRERLSRPDPADDRRRDRRSGDVPLRPLRPAAVRVRRHRRPGPLQAVPGLPEDPDRHRRDHDADGGRGREGVRLDA